MLMQISHENFISEKMGFMLISKHITKSHYARNVSVRIAKFGEKNILGDK